MGRRSLDQLRRADAGPRRTPGCCIRGWAIITCRSSASRTPPPPIARSWRAIRRTNMRRCCRTQAIDAYRKGGFADLVLEGKAEYVRTYGFKAPFWKDREHERYPKWSRELKTNLKDRRAVLPCHRSENQEARGLHGGRALVSQSTCDLSHRSRRQRDQLPAGRCLVRGSPILGRCHRIRAHRL